MMKSIITICLLISIYGSVASASGKCTGVKLAKTQKKVATFMKIYSEVKDPWSGFRNAFKENRDCMKIYEAYDFGDAIFSILKGRWSNVDELDKYKKSDKEFYSFVLSALEDEAASSGDIRAIYELTKKCPTGADAICREIALKSKPN